MRKQRQVQPPPEVFDESLARLSRVERELWEAVEQAKATRPASLTGLFDQIRKVESDKVRLLTEQLREAREGPPPWWNDMRTRLTDVLQKHPAALEDVLEALEAGPKHLQ